MNKIKQNKITFSLILVALVIFFSSFAILSLPVLFNYKSDVVKIEKSFYKNFKFYLNTSGKISYKPFPRPHLLLENAFLDLSKNGKNNSFIKTSNLKIFISLRDIYLRSFENFISTEIIETNLEFKLLDIINLRDHLYKKINKPIYLVNCKIFIRNKNDDAILISPIDKVSYKINNKTKNKNLLIIGEAFGIKFKSDWERNYKTPNQSNHFINLYNPNITIRNIIQFENSKNFKGYSYIDYANNKLEYNFIVNKDKVEISSPKKNDINFRIDSDIRLSPFYFDGSISIKNIKLDKIIDNLLLNLFHYNENYLGNISGVFKIKFKEINNKLIKNGEINLKIDEKKIYLNNLKFSLGKIGELTTNINFNEKQGEYKFSSKNKLIIKDHIEFAKIFQIGSKKAKKIEQINFDAEKDIGSTEFTISNIKINNINSKEKSNQKFNVKNIQNLRAHIRKVVD